MNLLSRKGIVILLISSLIAPFFTGTQAAEAAQAYQTEVIYRTGNGSLAVEPGSVTPVEVQFKNTGSATWSNDGPGYISLYTFEPKYRKSKFDPGTWLGPSQVKRIRQASVETGEKGTMIFELRAPETEGVFSETFHLASEDRAWVEGGEVTFNIEVREVTERAGQEEVEEIPVVEVKEVREEDISAEVVAQTITQINAEAGTIYNVQMAIANTGEKTWSSYGLKPSSEMSELLKLQLQTEDWGRVLAAQQNRAIAPGATGIISINIQAPKVNGVHTAIFEVMVDEIYKTEVITEVEFVVTDGVENTEISEEDLRTYEQEPLIRVGLLTVDEETNNEVIIRGITSRVRVETLSGELLLELAKGEEIKAAYNGSGYLYQVGATLGASQEPIRFIPETEEDVLEIANFDRRATRGADFADNMFRGTLEIRHNTKKDRVWLINELPIELYLRGLNESHNLSPQEFQEAKITAARTFAYFHLLRNNKWDEEHFIVTAYSYDQVYNGYGKEQRSPNIVKAVNDTAGQVLTYEGEVIMAPYFTQSNGATKNWSDVWWGSQPWAVAVEVPCDAGKRMLGHGVGMSGQGAICMANQGMQSEEILKHFYTGVKIEKIWK